MYLILKMVDLTMKFKILTKKLGDGKKMKEIVNVTPDDENIKFNRFSKDLVFIYFQLYYS